MKNYQLSWRKRRQWPVGRWRDLKRTLLLLGVGFSTWAVIALGEAWLEERNNRLSSENAHMSLISDVWRLTHFGAPGTTTTDINEGTAYTTIRHIHR